MKPQKFEQIVGRARGMENMVKDYDGDKLINILDCKPYDKNKQGVVHDIVERFRESREERKADKETYRMARSEARQVRREERAKQMVNFERERSNIDAERRVAEYKKRQSQPGFFSTLLNPPKRAPETRVRYIKKKGKAVKSRKIYQKPRQPRSLSDIKFDYGKSII